MNGSQELCSGEDIGWPGKSLSFYKYRTLTANAPADLQYLLFNDDMTALNEAIERQNLPRLVFMFDEVELLNEFGGRDTLDWFRSLIQSLTYCIFIVAGSDQLYALTQDYGSPFYNIFKTIVLFSLTSAAARTVIAEPAAAIGLQIAPAEVDKILAATGNTPYFIQGIAHYLSELQTLCFYLGIDYENLAGTTKEDKAAALIEDLTRLKQLGFLYEQTGSYTFTSGCLQAWITANKPL